MNTSFCHILIHVVYLYLMENISLIHFTALQCAALYCDLYVNRAPSQSSLGADLETGMKGEKGTVAIEAQ